MPLTYNGHFKNGKPILPESLKIRDDAKFTIIIEDEVERQVRRERQHKALNDFFESKEQDNEPLGEEFDDMINNHKFNITRELDL